MTVVKTDVTLLQRCRWILNTIFHQAVAVVTVFIFWTFFSNFKFNVALTWHVVLCVAAYVPLMTEAIILFAGDNLWTQKLDRTKRYRLHGGLMGVSITAVTVGISFEIYHKNQSNSNHFISNHAITGLVSWLLAMLGLFLGLFSWHAQSFKSLARPVIFKFVHNFIGITCYTLGIITICLGLNKGVFSRLVTDNELKAVVGVIGIIAIWSLFAALRSAYYQLKTMFS